MFITCTLKSTREFSLFDALDFCRAKEINDLEAMLEDLGFGRLSRKHLEDRKLVIEISRNEITDTELAEISERLNCAVYAFFMGCFGTKTFNQMHNGERP